ncbi:MAG TPA: DUF3305 domain-containing protein [Burkholderiales bacterium]|jgi:hypothetical protein|nr:DUF3305 domain-containing protein [Burkholderiales bacterium]
MSDASPDASPLSYPLAVIMQRTALVNRWATEKWEAQGVLRDLDATGAAPKVIVKHETITQILHPGLRLRLQRDEAEGYYLNLTSPEPKVFVLWRMVDEIARPERVTVSYGEGARWADSGEQVDGVPIPNDLLPWIAQFIDAHYRPEPKKEKRYASNKDKGRMGHFK